MLIAMSEVADAQVPGFAPCERVRPRTAQGTGRPVRVVTVTGPLVFDLTIPLELVVRGAARDVAVHQVVASG